ncbi:EamA family transporter [Massilia glaciei]|uniref:EamA family transporter n=1 Tax=Massilia glaciei TaxID=1524097 RepID=A0A2U2HFN9_9BURK|nr:EamA family transporter [Massilia glaciei]PWF43157.1 EamA family transporter [Massilia glaciei]
MQADVSKTAAPGSDGMLLASLAMLGSQVSLNIGAAVGKHLFPVIGVEGVTAFRVGFSALFLLAVFRPWRYALTRRDALNLLVYGTVIGVMNLLIYHAFSRIPIGIAVAIEVTGPLLLALLASRRLRDVAACALAVFGLWLLLPLHTGAGRLDPVGVACAFGAAACWALYIVFGKRASSLRGGQAVAWGMLMASVFIVPLGVISVDPAQLTPALVATGVAIAVLSSAVPYSLEMLALRGLPQGLYGMFSSSAPAVSALAGLLILGEHLSAVQWSAIACIVLASAICAVSARG